MIWDRLFKTYQPETEKVQYGVTEGFISHNPLVLMVYGFKKLFRRGNKPANSPTGFSVSPSLSQPCVPQAIQ
jgi:hypothetical protein